MESICGFDFTMFCKAKELFEVIEQGHIRTRESVYGLPIVTNAEEFRKAFRI